jgi:Txe/YoeB family toxin of Txe-Axe toxin-antitoxin module
MKNTTYRKKSWICNILVISDPKNRENEGKVFLFEFGKQIFDILKEAIQPEDKTEKPLFYYCPDSGANFKIKVKKDGQFPTWARSSFATPAPIDEDLDTLNIDDEYWLNAIYNLDDVISENSYKEYAELKTKFNKFLATIDMNGLSETNEMEKTQKESSESYSRMKQTAETKIEEKEEKEVKKEPAKKETKIESKETNKKLKNYFEEVADED